MTSEYFFQCKKYPGNDLSLKLNCIISGGLDENDKNVVNLFETDLLCLLN